jgi:hypothetical protein
MSSKRSFDEPAVRELLTGLVRSGKRYYRAGSHMPVAARVELLKLHMSEATGSRLLREAVSAGLITEEEIAQESHGRVTSTCESQAEACDTRAAEKEAAVVANSTEDDSDEEDEEDAPKEGGTHCRKSPLGLSDVPRGELDRYELVKTGSGFWGYFDREQQREVILSRDRDEVLEEIYALRRQSSDPSLCYAGRFNS